MFFFFWLYQQVKLAGSLQERGKSPGVHPSVLQIIIFKQILIIEQDI